MLRAIQFFFLSLLHQESVEVDNQSNLPFLVCEANMQSNGYVPSSHKTCKLTIKKADTTCQDLPCRRLKKLILCPIYHLIMQRIERTEQDHEFRNLLSIPMVSSF